MMIWSRLLSTCWKRKTGKAEKLSEYKPEAQASERAGQLFTRLRFGLVWMHELLQTNYLRLCR